MKKFIEIILFSLGVLVLLPGCYMLGKTVLNYRSFDETDVFMWGDNQMYRAIDMALLDSLPNSFLSAAEHGSGV
jgi:hypothetical protein